MKRGKHDIKRPFESDLHPGIVIHDSEGYQSGGTAEVEAFTAFLKDRAGPTQHDSRERLDAIW
jgi:hypothetical protein